MALLENRFRTLYAALFIVFILFGTSITLVGATLPAILESFRWSYLGAGAVLAAASIGSFISTYAAGRLMGRLGPRNSLLIGLFLASGGLAFFASSPSLTVNLLLYFALGAGQGFLELTVNWSVVRMGGKKEDGRAMSLMHGAFSIGAVLGPFLVGALARTGLPWTLFYRVIAALFALSAILALRLPFALLGSDVSDPAVRSRAHIRHPAFYLGFAVLFLYVGTELGISNWAAEFFVRIFKAGPETGAFMVSLFWAGLLAGRFGFPLLLKKHRQERLLLILGIGLSLAVGLLYAAGRAGPSALVLGALAVAAAGLASSSIYPATVSLVGAAFPEAQGEALGFASTGASVGAFAFPFLMSGIAERVGIGAGFGFYALSAILTAAAIMALNASLAGRK